MHFKIIVILVALFLFVDSANGNTKVKKFVNKKALIIKKADENNGANPGDECMSVWKVTYKKSQYYIKDAVPIVIETKECEDGGSFECPLSVCTEDFIA